MVEMEIEEAVKTFWQSLENVSELRVSVEKPYSNGLKLTAKAVVSGVNKSVAAPNMPDFFKSLKHYAREGAWNRMEIVVTGADNIKISSSYDVALAESKMS